MLDAPCGGGKKRRGEARLGGLWVDGLPAAVEDRISSREQTKRGGPPAWGLGVGLTTLHSKQ
jgi:hypothetical protein